MGIFSGLSLKSTFGFPHALATAITEAPVFEEKQPLDYSIHGGMISGDFPLVADLVQRTFEAVKGSFSEGKSEAIDLAHIYSQFAYSHNILIYRYGLSGTDARNVKFRFANGCITPFFQNGSGEFHCTDSRLCSDVNSLILAFGFSYSIICHPGLYIVKVDNNNGCGNLKSSEYVVTQNGNGFGNLVSHSIMRTITMMDETVERERFTQVGDVVTQDFGISIECNL